MGESKPIDFVLYIGSENMNEPAFQYLAKHKKSTVGAPFFNNDCKIYTCTIGLKSTNANYYLEQAEINFTLKKLKAGPDQRPMRKDTRRVQSQANFHNSANFLFSSSRSIQVRDVDE